jgi:hypothetical protein
VYLKGPDDLKNGAGVANVEGEGELIQKTLAKVFIEPKWREGTADKIPASVILSILGEPNVTVFLDPYGPLRAPDAAYDELFGQRCRKELVFTNSTVPPLAFKQVQHRTDIQVLLLRAQHRDMNLIAAGRAPEPYRANYAYTYRGFARQDDDFDPAESVAGPGIGLSLFSVRASRAGITIYDDVVSMESIAFKHYRPEVTRERTMACVFLHELGHILLRQIEEPHSDKRDPGIRTIMKQSSWASEAEARAAADAAAALDWGKDVGGEVRLRSIPNEPLP